MQIISYKNSGGFGVNKDDVVQKIEPHEYSMIHYAITFTPKAELKEIINTKKHLENKDIPRELLLITIATQHHYNNEHYSKNINTITRLLDHLKLTYSDIETINENNNLIVLTAEGQKKCDTWFDTHVYPSTDLKHNCDETQSTTPDNNLKGMTINQTIETVKEKKENLEQAFNSCMR